VTESAWKSSVLVLLFPQTVAMKIIVLLLLVSTAYVAFAIEATNVSFAMDFLLLSTFILLIYFSVPKVHQSRMQLEWKNCSKDILQRQTSFKESVFSEHER
jgi:hypothetical protein